MNNEQKQKRQQSGPQTPVGQPFVADTSGIFSTPRSIRTDAGDMANNHAREIVAQNMNDETLECDMAVFVEDYGASMVDSQLVSSCWDHLKKTGIISNENIWTNFPISPSKSKGTDRDIYQPLGRIVKAIFDYARENGKRNNRFVFKMFSDKNLKADIPGTNHRMDACIVEPAADVGDDWPEEDVEEKGLMPNHRVGIVIEGRTGNFFDDTPQAHKKLLGDAHHILCDDARRMFIYGITIVSSKMTAWYFSRSHSVRSTGFDWLGGDGINTFIKFMLSFALATPEGLGIDPRVHKAPAFHGEEGQQYIYEIDVPSSAGSGFHPPPRPELRSNTVLKANKAGAATQGIHKRYFRTVRILSHERPLCISGRVTRIWTVREVASVETSQCFVGETLILKDVWTDSEDLTEVQNLTAIFQAVDQFVDSAKQKYPAEPNGLRRFMDADPRFEEFDNNTKDRLEKLLTERNYESLFLTPLYANNGKETKPRSKKLRAPAGSVFVSEIKYGRPGTQSRTLQRSANPTQCTLGIRNPATSTPAQGHGARRRGYGQKTQRRFIYKEVCVPSYDLPTFGDAMGVMRQTVDALQILYCAGWVHRDISVGNVLAIKVMEEGKTSYKVKLSDFEFAQPISTVTHRSDPRTGTPFFMPVEIMDRQYLLNTIRKHIEDPSGGQQTNAIASLLANSRKRQPCHKAPIDTTSSWGIQPDHSFFEKLKEFKYSSELLPVPPSACTLLVPHHDTVVNYNYQHDLESVWWMVIYFVTMLANHEPSCASGLAWFTHDLNAAKRKEFLRDDIPAAFKGNLKEEFRDVFPTAIEDMRKALSTQYIVRALYGQLKDNSAYSLIHMEFARVLDWITETIPHTTWASLPIKKIGSIPGVKVNNMPSLGRAVKRGADSHAPRSQDC